MGASEVNHCWYQKTRRIALSYRIKTSKVEIFFVLSQTTRVTDGGMDRWT